MTIARIGAAVLTMLVLAAPAAAGESSPTLAELETEVVCPTCHTTLDQSSSPVANRMRTFIRLRIAAGDTKAEIKDRLVAEFGEQVLASPSRRGFNLLAWVLPLAAVIAGVLVVGFLVARWSRRPQAGAGPPSPGPVDERRIDEELARLDR